MKRPETPPPCIWADLWASWDGGCAIGALPLEGGVTFTEILVRSPRSVLRLGERVIDWWPTAKVTQRRAALAQGGVLGVSWDTPKGTLPTAELLHACDGKPEAQAAVLIAASVWDKEHNLPETWRGDTYRLLQQIQLVIFYAADGLFQQHGLSVWHHAMRNALPINIMGCDFAECVRPRGYGDLVSIALLDATLATSAWTPVIVSHDDRGLRKV